MGKLQLNLVTFPLWWYTTGWNLLWSWNKRQAILGLHHTGLVLFLHQMSQPLYGDYTKEGRFLSFLLRLVLLAFKSIFLILRLAIVAVVDILFLIGLPVLLALIIYELIPGRL